mmetsp:Transcript_100905/g.263089  ORF Transcript_100905/g.263089 Transcript_100905/m.263089 type:complete len:210 (+) Transcript_100905:1279-1908(+)
MIGNSPTSLASSTSFFRRLLPVLSREFLTSTMISSRILLSSTGSCDSFLTGFCLFFGSADTMLAMSMMFMTRSKSLVAQLDAIFRKRSLLGTSSSSQRCSMRPMIPCRGLRSSCETMAMKLILRCSASLYAVTSVRSYPTRVTPLMKPALFRLGVALSTSVAAFRQRSWRHQPSSCPGFSVVSTLPPSWPSRALPITCSAWALLPMPIM